MAFEADILITTPDGIELVVEAEVSLPNLERTEEELKKYMVGKLHDRWYRIMLIIPRGSIRLDSIPFTDHANMLDPAKKGIYGKRKITSLARNIRAKEDAYFQS